MDRISDPKVIAREYASTGRLAARRLDRTAWLRGEDEPWQVALKAIAEVRPRRVLDAGCGNADLAALITAPELVCVDASEAAVEAARGKGLDAVVAEIEHLPFNDGRFDLVTCNWVLYHLSDIDTGIEEIARVLRSGGRFVGIYNCRDHLSELWQAVGDPFADARRFDCESAPDLLRKQFNSVERRGTVTEAMWETRDALQAYLDAFVEMVGRQLGAPMGPYPFRATRRNCVLVADK